MLCLLGWFYPGWAFRTVRGGRGHLGVFSLLSSQTPTPTQFSGETNTLDSDNLLEDVFVAVVQLQAHKNA